MNPHSFAGWELLLWQWDPRLLSAVPLSGNVHAPEPRGGAGTKRLPGFGMDKDQDALYYSFLLARNWEEGICYTKKFNTFLSF